MKEFQLSRYIKKWLPLIVAFCFGLTIVVYLVLSSSRNYIASAVIQYNDPSAEQGLTPLGTALNVDEIKSSAILSQVISSLGLDGSYSVDDLISRVKITGVPDEDQIAKKEAMLEEGQEYVYEPTVYIVSFEAKNNEGEAFARRVLDEILDIYFADYSENYVNVSTVTDSISRLYNGNYDYIEMMELIDESISDTVSALYTRINQAPYFRSTETGMSFTDLVNEFNFLQQVKVSELFSKIFEYQVTKDKALLVADYSTRISTHNIENKAEEEKISDVLQLIDAYVEKMRNSDNTNITYEYILEDVYEKELLNRAGELLGSGDQTVTYDKLIYSWRDHTETKEYAIIDSAYCNYIIDVFSSCSDGCYCPGGCAGTAAEGGEAVTSQTSCALSDLTCAARNNPNYAAIEAEVDQSIRQLVDQLDGLYQISNATNTEYNEYLGASNISMLSTVSVAESINVVLYTIIAAIFLLVVCCCGAILLGRLNDIIQYAFYTDHMTGMNNRMFFDNYLKAQDRKILDDGTVCASITIVNQVDFNRRFGREAGDELIKLFADTLRDAFRKTGAQLIYNGNAHYIVILEKTDYVTVEYMLQRFRLLLDERETLKEGRIEYEIGIAETYRDRIRKARGLLSKAVGARVRYVSEPVNEKTDGEKESV